MDRRRFLSAAATSVAVGAAGCNDFDSIVDNSSGTRSDGSDSDPAGAVREFYRAVGDGDAAAAAALIHPDSDVSTTSIEETAGQFSNATVERVTVLDRNETRAIVQTSVTLAGGSQERTVEAALGVRRVDGRWRVYGLTDRETVGGDRPQESNSPERTDRPNESGGPRGTARQFFRSLADGETERAVELVHPDAPDRETLVSQTRETRRLERFRFDRVLVVEEGADRAVVELAYTFSQDGETERTGAAGLELRTVNGEWQVYRQMRPETVEPRETETATPEETETATPADVDGDPAEVARRFYRRVADGDSERAQDLLHPDSSATIRALAEQAPSIETLRIDEVAVVEREDTRAVVELSFTFSQDGETQSSAIGIVLRPAEGQWRVFRRVDPSTVEPRETETATPEETETATPADVDGDPAEVVRRFYAALGEGDVTAVRSLVHPDSPLRELSDDQIEQASEAEVEVTVRGQEESTGRALVQVELAVSREGSTQTNTVRLELRPADGRWRVYELR